MSPDPLNATKAGSGGRPDLPECLLGRVDWRYRNFAGAGWWPLLEEMHEQLLAIDPNYRLAQVKEKHGLLRVYVDDEHYTGTAAATDLVVRIESVLTRYAERSGSVCERCGAPGRTHSDQEWMRMRRYILTLCDNCAAHETSPLARLTRAAVARQIIHGITPQSEQDAGQN